MAVPRKDETGSRAYTVPLLWICVLLAGYWLIADWQDLPQMITTALSRL